MAEDCCRRRVAKLLGTANKTSPRAASRTCMWCSIADSFYTMTQGYGTSMPIHRLELCSISVPCAVDVVCGGTEGVRERCQQCFRTKTWPTFMYTDSPFLLGASAVHAHFGLLRPCVMRTHTNRLPACRRTAGKPTAISGRNILSCVWIHACKLPSASRTRSIHSSQSPSNSYLASCSAVCSLIQRVGMPPTSS